ncbi:MAG TPA: efflux RND transporter periplasmic adaptor subunit [Candidatus Saccharimonadales bacterium]|jgi:HlyD family secretion protein|nr:efflux RND transporter periplasmic adaptor subunit [Candidatus Saccharimonadales bacterium]
MVHKEPTFLERNRLFMGVAGAILALLLFSGWVMRRGAIAVRSEKVVREQIASVISTNGKIEPVRNFEAHAPAPAIVKRVLVREGDQVKAGQLLLELDDIEARANAAKSLAQVRAAESDLHSLRSGGTQEELLTNRSNLVKAQAEKEAADRNLLATVRLQQNGAASPAEVEEARNRAKRAEAEIGLLKSRQTSRFSDPERQKVEAYAAQTRAEYEAARQLISNSHVRAPFAGTVYHLPVKPGAYASAGELLVQVANLDSMLVRAFVDEPEIGKLAKGEKIEVTWDALPGRTWSGSLSRVPTAVSTLGPRTVGEITSAMANDDHRLLPNVNVSVSVITARHESALTVSREAVHDLAGKHVLYEIVDNKIAMREVQTGTSSLTRVEIVSGISEGTSIAMGAVNAQSLRNGMEVKAVER